MPHIVIDRNMLAPASAPIASGEAVYYSAARPGASALNEDSAALVATGPSSGVLVVADGVGGQPRGASASRTVIDCLETALARANGEAGSMRAAVLDGLEQANREVLAQGQGSASTVAAVELSEGSLRSYHVGDAAVVAVGQRGRLKLQTVAHSPVGYGVEAGLLDEREAMRHDERHLVSNAVGAADMRIEIGSRLELAPLDTLLVATDGLTDNLLMSEVVQAIRARPLEVVAAELVERCRRRMASSGGEAPSKPDDLTFILFRLRAPRGASRAR